MDRKTFLSVLKMGKNFTRKICGAAPGVHLRADFRCAPESDADPCYAWIPVVAPVAGALAAVALYRVFPWPAS